MLYFEWEARKEGSNVKKHGVDFAEASTVFGTPWSAPSLIRTTPWRSTDS